MISTTSPSISTTGWSGYQTVFAIPTITPTGGAITGPVFTLPVFPLGTPTIDSVTASTTVGVRPIDISTGQCRALA